jgi:hypothetical protein
MGLDHLPPVHAVHLMDRRYDLDLTQPLAVAGAVFERQLTQPAFWLDSDKRCLMFGRSQFGKSHGSSHPARSMIVAFLVTGKQVVFI